MHFSSFLKNYSMQLSAVLLLSRTESCLLKPPGRCLLEMVLQSHIEIKGIPPVPKANTYESTATCRQDKTYLMTWTKLSLVNPISYPPTLYTVDV